MSLTLTHFPELMRSFHFWELFCIDKHDHLITCDEPTGTGVLGSWLDLHNLCASFALLYFTSSFMYTHRTTSFLAHHEDIITFWQIIQFIHIFAHMYIVVVSKGDWKEMKKSRIRSWDVFVYCCACAFVHPCPMSV